MSTRIVIGDCRDALRTLPDESVHCVVTSPPYWGLRDYGVGADAFGMEPIYQLYIEHAVEVFREVRRVLRADGTLWLNLGDSYANDGKWGGETGGKQFYLGEANRQRVGREKRITGLKPKDLIGIPWRVAFALQADGWWLRQDIIWSKPNPMPESVRDRCTKSHEYIFLLAKSEHYYFDAEAIAEPFADEHMGNPGVYKRTTAVAKGACNDRQDLGFLNNGDGWNASGGKSTRNRRDVWTVASQPFSQAHYAVFPPALIEPCILAGCPAGGTVLDPFFGAGTTGLVADRLRRDCIGIELNPAYAAMAERRIRDDAGMFARVAAE